MAKAADRFTDPCIRQVAALPWRRELDGTLSVLLVTSRTNGKWMLPKGWAMVGKTDAEAARQEAFEEAGVESQISELPVGSYAYIKLFDDGSTKPSRAVVFSMQVTKQLRKWQERGQRRRKWFPVAEAATVVFERDLARLLNGLAAGRVGV